MGEFDLIARYFTRPVRRAALGVGDDCALLAPAPGMQLAVSSDMLVEGRHFFAGVDPEALGHKALAVNLSDLAACGARPLAFTLALALPRIDEPWLQGFAQGLLQLADAHDCELVGGDTTAGPLNICVTIFGEVPAGQALLRSGARADDDIWVSGAPGEARLALDALRGQLQLPAATLARLRVRLECPTPRVALGQVLRGLASSAIDLSDGLLGDLGHVLKASGVGAEIDAFAASDLLAASAYQKSTAAQNTPSPSPLSHKGRGELGQRPGSSKEEGAKPAPPIALAPLGRGRGEGLPADTLLQCALAGGDDYELAFTAAPAQRAAVQAAGAASATPVTRIGRITPEPGLRLLDRTGGTLQGRFASFDHFA